MKTIVIEVFFKGGGSLRVRTPLERAREISAQLSDVWRNHFQNHEKRNHTFRLIDHETGTHVEFLLSELAGFQARPHVKSVQERLAESQEKIAGAMGPEEPWK